MGGWVKGWWGGWEVGLRGGGEDCWEVVRKEWEDRDGEEGGFRSCGEGGRIVKGHLVRRVVEYYKLCTCSCLDVFKVLISGMFLLSCLFSCWVYPLRYSRRSYSNSGIPHRVCLPTCSW